ncbi:unnamed protein product [Citrullus colocynthis]|uniref:Uncharacterized protein n=1 Tax=Citrullus colocynthis TaxID=252529 RepID=A0ABP0XNG6_9ROSI
MAKAEPSRNPFAAINKSPYKGSKASSEKKIHSPEVGRSRGLISSNQFNVNTKVASINEHLMLDKSEVGWSKSKGRFAFLPKNSNDNYGLNEKPLEDRTPTAIPNPQDHQESVHNPMAAKIFPPIVNTSAKTSALASNQSPFIDRVWNSKGRRKLLRPYTKHYIQKKTSFSNSWTAIANSNLF